MRLLIAALLLAVFLYPKITYAEIATVRDWVGLFPINAKGVKANAVALPSPTATFPDGHAWAYTSSTSNITTTICTQTPGSVPKLDRAAGCTFTVPFPLSGYYVFKMYANDKDDDTPDALLSTSNSFSINAANILIPVRPAGILYSIAKVVDGTTGTITQNGDLTINSDIAVTETGVIFVDGNLYINHNLENNLPTKGLVFVVKGSIYVRRDVTKINAFLISHGRAVAYRDGDDNGKDCTWRAANNFDITPFCSAWDGTTPPNPDGSSCADFSNAQIGSRVRLTINGSVISLNSCKLPQFIRQYTEAVPNAPSAEVINFEPKYLVNMKDIFSRDVKIWQEVQ